MKVQANMRERAERHAKRKRLPTLIVLVGVSILILAQTTKFLHNRMSDNNTSITDSLSQIFSSPTPLPSTEPQSTLSGISASSDISATTATFSSDVKQMLVDAQSWPNSTFKLQPQEWTHASGTRIYFIPSAEIPILDLRLVFNAGSARDDNLPGLANLTAMLMTQGTDKFDVNSINEQLEKLGSHVSMNAYRDMAVLQLRTLTDPAHLQPTLQLLAAILSSPSFPKPAIERIRNQLLINLQKQQQEPQTLVKKQLWQTLYPQHPYGHPSIGNQDSIVAIQQNHINAFHKNHYGASNAVLALVGAIDRSTAEMIATQLLTGLPSTSVPPPLSTPTQHEQTLTANQIAGKHLHISFPTQQTHIQLGVLAIERNHADYASLLLANEILGGGGFSSRLNQAIREDAGLAYSVGSYFTPMQTQGPLIISLQTRNEKAHEALQKIEEVLYKVMSEGPSDTEITSARQHLLRSYPLSLASNMDQVSQLANLAFYHLPASELNDFPRQLSLVGRNDIVRVLNKLLSRERRVLITLGPVNPYTKSTASIKAESTPASATSDLSTPMKNDADISMNPSS